MRKFFILFILSFVLLSCSESNTQDWCNPNPCADSAVPHKTVCVPNSINFTCACSEGYEENEAGACVKVVVDPCHPNPCKDANKTSCQVDGESFTCSCDSGYELNGETCEWIPTPCDENPCAASLIPHKTKCIVTGTDFTCGCEENYALKGSLCVLIGDACEDNPCKEAFKTNCTSTGSTIEDYTCSCVNGYHLEGENCVETVNPCEPNPCTESHKTSCVARSQTAGDYQCQCDNGYVLDENGACIVQPLSANCHMPKYQGIFNNNLRDLALIQELHRITSLNYNSLGYSTAKVKLYDVVDNIDDQNQCVYTGVWYGAGSGVNCEHTWPQSQFGRDEPMRSDLHHLFPTDSRVNSSRGHLRFANVADHVNDYNDYDEYGECNESSPDYYCSKRLLSGGDNGIFEPADQHKGNVARAIFYFAVRYGNMSGEINDVVAPFINEDMKLTLVQWNKLDPVDAKELLRNDRIEPLQNNRNPFIDCPEFFDRIDFQSIDFPESY